MRSGRDAGYWRLVAAETGRARQRVVRQLGRFPSVTPITANDWVAHWLAKQPGGTYSYDVAIASPGRRRELELAADPARRWHPHGTRLRHAVPWGDGFGAVWLDGRNTRQDGAGDAATQKPAA